jgi:tripeptidyl-peptidase I
LAGIIGLLNDARFKAGLPSVGFVNPWLYESGNDFIVDITGGAARGCDGTNHQQGKKIEGAGIIPGAFWNATAGWDPVTGLGIPDFQKWVTAALDDASSGDSDDE